MNQANPIVTSWSASEKANLQSLMANQGIAIKHMGCDIRLLPQCRIKGSYRWQKTTVATDQVEIRNADELYAKLPIGAVGLEGELKRSGRLVVETTVAGQMRLEASDLERLANDPQCAGATHVVSAVSVGAFQLRSGGAVSAGAGVSGLGAGAGAKHSAAGQIQSRAGNQAACGKNDSESPSYARSSPLQVFLQPIRSQRMTPGSVAGANGAAPPSPLNDSHTQQSFLSFRSHEDDEIWTLRDFQGGLLCRLPCEYPVNPDRRYRLRC